MEVGWFNIVKSIDSRGSAVDPPTFYILQQLVKQGYLRKEKASDLGRIHPVYRLTDEGRELLLELESD